LTNATECGINYIAGKIPDNKEGKPMQPNTWFQIHTNGATTTLARFYEGQTEAGAPTFVFEKVQFDITGDGSAETFGREDYATEAEAVNRLVVAIKEAV
jgi:hypothetical protein